MTDLRKLCEMLSRAKIGHGTRADYNPPGESVQIECEDEDTIVEFQFDNDGNLKSVHSYPFTEG